jgi:Rha family phage regulatory protein
MECMMDIIISQSCTVSSKQVAEKFGKRHDDVLKAYRNLRTQSNDLQHADFFQRNFAENNINTLYGKVELAEVSMTRDGFSLVAMGFTGAEALSWKVRFIEAFNAMESALRHHTIHEAPYKPKLLDKPKTARITESVQKIDTLFGETIFKRTMTRVSEEMLTPLERLQAKKFNLILQAEGVMKKVKKLEAEIDYLQQPAPLRLLKS